MKKLFVLTAHLLGNSPGTSKKMECPEGGYLHAMHKHDWGDFHYRITGKNEKGELQLEGADTYLSAFAQLKSYPFFRQAAHWFYPFDRQHPDIVKLFTNHKSTEGNRL